MPASAIKEWLAEYKSLAESELHTFASTVRNNEELTSALYDLFEDEPNQEVIDTVCHQLFDFYRSHEVELQRFTLEYVPTLIWNYLSAISKNQKKKCSGIEACLLGIYNLEIVDADGSPKVKAFTIPTLGKPSIYHQPLHLGSLALTESVLSRYENGETHVKSSSNLPQVEHINAQNRLVVMTKVLQAYNVDIANLDEKSHYTLCKMCSKLAKTGFGNLGQGGTSVDLNDSQSSSSSRGSRRGVLFRESPRITLTSDFLIELLNGIYYAMFNGQAQLGIQAVEDVHERAQYELWADVLLVTNAIKNSLHNNPSGQPHDGPMGISISLSPKSSTNVFTKSAITNASFRAKKLPDDIAVLDSEQGSSAQPPKYEDVQGQDEQHAKSESSDKVKSTSKLPANPIKSIMKKNAEKKAHQQQKRDSDPQASPRLSSGASFNGDILDPGMVSVSVVRSQSRSSHVDVIDMKHMNLLSEHRRTASFPENGFLSRDEQDATSTEMPKPNIQPASHAREVAFSGGSNSNSSNGSLTTHL